MSANKGRDISSRCPTNSILRSVSRSFYLSIRILPARLREPVSLGYLLARTTDTLADTAQVPTELRMQTLEKLSRVNQGETDSSDDPSASLRTSLVRQFVP
jgi:farnesyl-diphosphate farnesyltransferase